MMNKLCLGTVQLGLKYGINNQIGRKPTNKEAFSILKEAIDYGIEFFDTSSAYGEAEHLLGEFNIGEYKVNVISKLNMQKSVCANIQSNLLGELKVSLDRLQINHLDGYLLHNAKDFYQAGIMDALEFCKNKGLVKNIGVSVYEPEDALSAVKSRRIDYIQIPYNVFDQRLDQSDFFELAQKNGVKIFARSAFLQGLLLMDLKDIPNNMAITRPYIEQFNTIISNYGYSRCEAAFLFVYCHKGIDKLVFGVDTKEQLRGNLEILKKLDGFSECYNKLFGTFTDIEKEVIIPSLWRR